MIFAASILLTAGVLAFVLFVRSSDLPEAVPESPVLHLEERKAVIYDNLRDLNFEYRLGKLSDADYSKPSSRCKRAGLRLAGIDAILKGMPRRRRPRSSAAQPAAQSAAGPALICPHCGATFDKPMKLAANAARQCRR